MINSILIIKTVFLFVLNLSYLVKNGLSYTYFFDKGPVSFIKAIQICNDINASLLVIDDVTESAIVIKDY